MSFSLAGNLHRVSPEALRQFSKNYGVILSKEQHFRQQYLLVHNAIRFHRNILTDLSKLGKGELLSFVFLLTQFGDVQAENTPLEFLNLRTVPFVLEWSRGNYMVPLEVLESLSTEKLFKEQDYLFALIPMLTIKEKRAWIKWLSIDYEGDNDWDMNHAIYQKCRTLQFPYKGKSFIHEQQFFLDKLWKPGSNSIVDWFYKGLTPFYYSMNELQKVEKDPFYKHIIDIIRAGKLVLKKEPDRFKEKTRYKLVASVEGCTEQIRTDVFQYEHQAEVNKNSLFSYNIHNSMKESNSDI